MVPILLVRGALLPRCLTLYAFAYRSTQVTKDCHDCLVVRLSSCYNAHMSPIKRNRAVVYYRVSDIKQGKSGLGLEAQRVAVEAYIAANGCTQLGAYVEVETGK